MPRKPKKMCSYPNCPELTHFRYCKKHSALVNKNYNEHERNKNNTLRYNSAWRNARAAFIKTHPYCEECKKRGILTPVEEVHHIIPVSQNGTNEESNLMSLCSHHHRQLHVKDGSKFRKKVYECKEYQK